MKRYRLTFIARIFLAALALFFIWVHESSRGLFPASGSELLISEATLDEVKKPLNLVLGVTDLSEASGLVIANGGTDTVKGSILSNMNVSMSVKVFSDRLELERGFLHGSVNLMATTPSRFGAAYPTMDSISPVAFMLSAPSIDKAAIISAKNISSTSDLAGMKIACVRGSSAFFFVYYLATLSGSDRNITWLFTNDDEESILLYRKGKADAIAANTNLVKLPGDLPISITSDIAPFFFSTVIVARESLIIAHQKTFTSLVDAQFLSRKNILALKDADAIQTMTHAGINPAQRINPAALIASDEDNRIFFRLSQTRLWDYFNQFDLGSDAAKNLIVKNDILALETAHTLLITDSKSNSGKTSSQSSMPLPKKQLILIQNKLQFKKDNNELSVESKSAVKDLLRKSISFPLSVFAVSGGTPSAPAESALISQREQTIRNFLSQEYSVQYTRITNGQSKDPSLSLIIPAASK